MAAKKNPGALAGATGAGKPVHAIAEGTRLIARNSSNGTPYLVTPNEGDAFRIVVSGRVRYLRRLYGLTEAQAHAVAVLIWGAGI
jgi:hypothetical protein